MLCSPSLGSSNSRRGLVLALLLLLILPFNNFSKISQINFSIINFRVFIFFIGFYFLFITALNVINKIDANSDASNLVINRLKTTIDFIDVENTRSQRWIYALNLYSDYNFSQLIFGNGFDYIEKYSGNFYLESDDYPHNFLLSALLYSGILGFLSILYMILFILRSFGDNKFPLIISYGFFFVLILQFTSSNSLFSIGITIFLISLLLNFKKMQKYL